MFKYIKFPIITICFCLLFSCNTENNKPLVISFSSDSSQIVVKDIHEVELFQIRSHIDTDSAYQKLVTVLQTPAEDDSTSMETEWPGKLTIAKDHLLFTPNVPFVKGKTYLVETILNTEFASGEDIVKGRMNVQIKPQQQILKR